MVGIGYVSETSFVLQDLEGEHIEDYLRHHIEKLALKFQWPVLRPVWQMYVDQIEPILI